ncbi:MAG: hypothetical protein UU93_C0003G0008 [Candidatus Amesbacteria bacterium GW2011_GWA2_42_12]|uniref:Uncharacterized protein n=1 Tax=Candidatus Amesbacteria bacterium GW2011_GWA2_42_12 TaxID=1618356 RepID=A0A0G0Y8G6_9BACT|nr:MAG: hypothetical protein UU93_C0003G0008 [Candidatus Amesbacteria bacterium GW2011_GWA2_42_12]
MSTSPDKVVVHSLGEGLLHKWKDVVVAVGLFGIAMLPILLAGMDPSRNAEAVPCSNSMLYVAGIGGGLYKTVRFMAWYLGHHPDHDRMAIKDSQNRRT